MSGISIEDELLKRAAYFEDILAKALPAEEGYARTVIEAMNYSLLAGGKRLRPVMMLEAFKLFAGEEADDVHEGLHAVDAQVVDDGSLACVLLWHYESVELLGTCTDGDG